MADGTLKVGTITTSSGSGTITIGQSGETVTIPSGCTVTNSGTATGFGFTNDEFFRYYQGSDQTLSNNTWTKLAMNTAVESNSNYDTSNYKYTVPSGKAGKYYIGISGNWLSAGDFDNCIVAIRKNGTTVVSNNIRQEYYENNFCAVLTTLAVGDYLEPYGLQQSGGNLDFRSPGSTASTGYIFGFRLGE